MGSLEVQPRTQIKGGLYKGILIFKIIVKGEKFGIEGNLGLREMPLVVVLKRELEFGEAVKQFT